MPKTKKEEENSNSNEAPIPESLFDKVYDTSYLKTILQCQIRIISRLESKDESEVFREVANLHTAFLDETYAEYKERIVSNEKFNKG